MREKEYIFTFKAKTFEWIDFIILMEEFYNLKEFKARFKGIAKGKFTDRLKKKLKDYNADEHIVLKDEITGQKLSLVTPFRKGKMYSQEILIYWIDKEPDIRLINKLISNDNFIVGYGFDYIFYYFQNAETTSSYELHGVPIPKDIKMVWNTIFNKEYIDISNNPGRHKIASELRIMAAWRMWFSPNYYKYVSKDRLLDFKHANEIMELENDRLYMELFEDSDKSSEKENLERMKAFRDWCRLSDLEDVLLSQ